MFLDPCLQLNELARRGFCFNFQGWIFLASLKPKWIHWLTSKERGWIFAMIPWWPIWDLINNIPRWSMMYGWSSVSSANDIKEVMEWSCKQSLVCSWNEVAYLDQVWWLSCSIRVLRSCFQFPFMYWSWVVCPVWPWRLETNDQRPRNSYQGSQGKDPR